jgi:hypothetical protein
MWAIRSPRLTLIKETPSEKRRAAPKALIHPLRFEVGEMDVSRSHAVGRALHTERRDIGPIGTLARVLGGVLALAIPIALDGLGWWDLAVGLVGLPLLAAVAFLIVRAGYERWAPGGLAAQSGTCCGAVCWLLAIVFAAFVPVAALTSVTGTAFWVWIGASLLLGAARGYGGCEILAFPNILAGRRDQVGCLVYTPIDRAEARRPCEAQTS